MTCSAETPCNTTCLSRLLYEASSASGTTRYITDSRPFGVAKFISSISKDPRPLTQTLEPDGITGMIVGSTFTTGSEGLVISITDPSSGFTAASLWAITTVSILPIRRPSGSIASPTAGTRLVIVGIQYLFRSKGSFSAPTGQ